MKILCFTLSMPKNNSWNGKWTGEESYFARTKRITENRKRKLEILGINFNKKMNIILFMIFKMVG